MILYFQAKCSEKSLENDFNALRSAVKKNKKKLVILQNIMNVELNVEKISDFIEDV